VNGTLRFLWNYQGNPTWDTEQVKSGDAGPPSMVQRPSGETDITAPISGTLTFLWNYQGNPKWEHERVTS